MRALALDMRERNDNFLPCAESSLVSEGPSAEELCRQLESGQLARRGVVVLDSVWPHTILSADGPMAAIVKKTASELLGRSVDKLFPLEADREAVRKATASALNDQSRAKLFTFHALGNGAVTEAFFIMGHSSEGAGRRACSLELLAVPQFTSCLARGNVSAFCRSSSPSRPVHDLGTEKEPTPPSNPTVHGHALHAHCEQPRSAQDSGVEDCSEPQMPSRQVPDMEQPDAMLHSVSSPVSTLSPRQLLNIELERRLSGGTQWAQSDMEIGGAGPYGGTHEETQLGEMLLGYSVPEEELSASEKQMAEKAWHR